MKNGAGICLKSTSSPVDDTVFGDTIIFITEYNTRGAIGFVLNKPFHRSLNELEEFKTSLPFPIYDGGPVDREHLFFIHNRADLVTGGTPVYNDIYFGGDFKHAVSMITSKILKAHNIKIFLGYCGWNAGELDEEINQGSWTLEGAEIDKVFI